MDYIQVQWVSSTVADTRSYEVSFRLTGPFRFFFLPPSSSSSSRDRLSSSVAFCRATAI